MLSKKSHFSLHEGHFSGGSSACSSYPKFPHFQLPMGHLLVDVDHVATIRGLRSVFSFRSWLYFSSARSFSFSAVVRNFLTCTILTREASESVRPIHHRMPVILKPEAYDPWLNPDNQQAESLQDIIQNRIYTELKSVPVSKQVNAVRNNRPDNIRPLELYSQG